MPQLQTGTVHYNWLCLMATPWFKIISHKSQHTWYKFWAINFDNFPVSFSCQTCQPNRSITIWSDVHYQQLSIHFSIRALRGANCDTQEYNNDNSSHVNMFARSIKLHYKLGIWPFILSYRKFLTDLKLQIIFWFYQPLWFRFKHIICA